MVIYSGDSAYMMLIHFGIRYLICIFFFITSSHIWMYMFWATVIVKLWFSRHRLVDQKKSELAQTFYTNINLEAAKMILKCTTALTTILSISPYTVSWEWEILVSWFWAVYGAFYLSHLRYHQVFASPAVILRYIHCKFWFLFLNFFDVSLRLLPLTIAHRNAYKKVSSLWLLYSVKIILHANLWKLITGALASNQNGPIQVRETCKKKITLHPKTIFCVSRCDIFQITRSIFMHRLWAPTVQRHLNLYDFIYSCFAL